MSTTSSAGDRGVVEERLLQQSAAASKTSNVLSTPVVDLETDCLDEQAVRGLLPLTLGKIAVPGITLTPSAFSVQTAWRIHLS
jgi:hypothetical protein